MAKLKEVEIISDVEGNGTAEAVSCQLFHGDFHPSGDLLFDLPKVGTGHAEVLRQFE